MKYKNIKTKSEAIRIAVKESLEQLEKNSAPNSMRLHKLTSS